MCLCVTDGWLWVISDNINIREGFYNRLGIPEGGGNDLIKGVGEGSEAGYKVGR